MNNVVAEESFYIPYASAPVVLYRLFGEGRLVLQSLQTLMSAGAKTWEEVTTKLSKSEDAILIHHKPYGAVYIPAGFFVFDACLNNTPTVVMRLNGAVPKVSEESMKLAKAFLTDVEKPEYEKFLANVVG